MVQIGSNEITVLGGDAAVAVAVEQLASGSGCQARRFGSPQALASVRETQAPPAVAILAELENAPAWLDALRGMGGDWSGTPVLALAAAGSDIEDVPSGCVGWLALPLDDSALERIEQWTGPLADLELRDGDAPEYRLLRLVGRDRAAGLLERLAERLADAGTMLERGTLSSELAHGLVGIAGLCGYHALASCWTAIERHDSAAIVEASSLISITRTRIARFLERISR